MKLEMRKRDGIKKSYQYYCKLTELLDEMLGISKRSLFKHYCLIDTEQLIVRVPGATIGYCALSEDKTIIDFYLKDSDYPVNVDTVLMEFKDEKVEWDE